MAKITAATRKRIDTVLAVLDTVRMASTDITTKPKKVGKHVYQAVLNRASGNDRSGYDVTVQRQEGASWTDVALGMWLPPDGILDSEECLDGSPMDAKLADKLAGALEDAWFEATKDEED